MDIRYWTVIDYFGQKKAKIDILHEMWKMVLCFTLIARIWENKNKELLVGYVFYLCFAVPAPLMKYASKLLKIWNTFMVN